MYADLKKRAVTAILLLVILAIVVLAHSLLAFKAIVFLFFSAAIWESLKLFSVSTSQKEPLFSRLQSVFLTGIALIILYWVTRQQEQHPIFSLVFFITCTIIWLFVLLPWMLYGLGKLPHYPLQGLIVSYQVTIVGCFSAVIFLYDKAPLDLLILFVVIWSSDTGAYLVGRRFGKHRLAPKISPGKTWEGVFGGMVFALLFTSLILIMPFAKSSMLQKLYQQNEVYLFYLYVVILIAVSIIGDLFESQLKRLRQIKDSGRILPGHGGVLDRIDALIPVLPLSAYLYFLLFL